MNKKGFTLVELLAVIALLAILMGIAVPNVISTINNNKRDTFLMDAKRMVSNAKYLISSNKDDRDSVLSNPKIYTFDVLNKKEEFQTDADGGSYDSSTYVKVSYDSASATYKYCICVSGSKRIISNSNTCTPSISSTDCLSSDDLTGIQVVKEKGSSNLNSDDSE